MKFKLMDNGSIIECDIIMTFKDASKDINYVVYTDGTKDENGELETYASRYVLENDNYVLNPIENDYEWDLIDNMLESKYWENN